MSVFKCKMCGGTIEFNKGDSVGVCDSCGTRQTLPRIDDDMRANLYDRANHFRRNNDYDKAMAIYERILNEDSTDAEAYWSLVLCRYGIEYVEDPASHKRVPTVNRTQFKSVYMDEDYKSALKYADGYQRKIYEEEAAAIDEIQKKILEISDKEEPFDVFICYKETDSSGRRTQDSVLANDLYHQLTQEGFKVFFSRITLEDKLGTAYEPYIFAALNSAKAMVVIGTRPEYFNAVWVRNEWSRYLSLISSGARKTLIPAYRDMDPYDLPEEFSHLQAQDMSKLGFMQDLIRGIRKIVSTDAPQPTAKGNPAADQGQGNTASLLKRAFLFLEDGDFKEANEYCDRVLDMEPECAEAYLGKLMAQWEVRRQEELAECGSSFENNNDYQKILRFGDEKLITTLKGYIGEIHKNIENARIEYIYNEAWGLMVSADEGKPYILDFIIGRADKDEALQIARELMDSTDKDEVREAAQEIYDEIEGYDEFYQEELYEDEFHESEFIEIKDIACDKETAYRYAAFSFDKLHDYKDSASFREQCLNKAEACRKDDIYASAEAKISGDNIIKGNEIKSYEAAIETFRKISGWRDSDDRIHACQQKIEELKAKAEKERLEARRKAEEKKIASEKRYRLTKRISIVIIAVLCVVCICILWKAVIKPAYEAHSAYKAAVSLIDDGKIVDAYERLIVMGGYKDSEEKAAEIFDQYKTEKLKTISTGDSFFFGKYEQDNDKSNGKEPIEWQVLDKKGSKVLLISKYGIDSQHYNDDYIDVTYETCSLRNWLNEKFMDNAFDPDDKQMIQITSVSPDKNPECDVDPGKRTEDKVFLLSIKEVERYFKDDKSRSCVATKYAAAQAENQAEAQGKYDNDYIPCWWWLRTPGYHIDYSDDNWGADKTRLDETDYVAYVETNGYIDYSGCRVIYDGSIGMDEGTFLYEIVAVRPALWVDLD